MPWRATLLEELDALTPLVARRSSPAAVQGSRLTFFRQWLRHPLRMSSITPSGRQLARMMAAAVSPDAQGVIELGAGTGVITQALINHGIRPERLLVVEMNDVLHELLRQAFPRANVVCGDARTLRKLTTEGGTFGTRPVDAVVSSLGLLAMPASVQHDILAAAFEILRPRGGVFVQYTYGPSRPVAAEVCATLGLRARRHGWAWRNLPPARVYVYSRD
jgi:phosphatidylethanolamine/phosphatidyl-N-methylethanolamine N-methyltransferase